MIRQGIYKRQSGGEILELFRDLGPPYFVGVLPDTWSVGDQVMVGDYPFVVLRAVTEQEVMNIYGPRAGARGDYDMWERTPEFSYFELVID